MDTPLDENMVQLLADDAENYAVKKLAKGWIQQREELEYLKTLVRELADRNHDCGDMRCRLCMVLGPNWQLQK